jgi:hypothetical protein|tara:strand:+ start:768 stop:1181 length:414 start_codon:yes stop_codon:yes gene_type:complete
MKILSLLSILALVGLTPVAFAQGPTDPMCWELGACPFADDPLGTMIQPFDGVFVGFSLVVFWGLLVGILWLRTHNTMLVSVIGIAMTMGYMATPEFLASGMTPQFEQARQVGAVLIVVSVLFAVYQIFIHRPHMQPN